VGGPASFRECAGLELTGRRSIRESWVRRLRTGWPAFHSRVLGAPDPNWPVGVPFAIPAPARPAPGMRHNAHHEQ